MPGCAAPPAYPHKRPRSGPRSCRRRREVDDRSGIGVWAAFLAVCFLVVGLMGLFASYAGQIPLERAAYRLHLLDQVQAAAREPDAAGRLTELRPLLADRANAVLDGAGPLDARLDAERKAALAEGVAESDAVSLRVRIMLLVVTVMSAAFGIGVMSIARRS